VLDLTVAATALVGLAPLMLAIAALVAIGLGRPVLVRETRPGRYTRPFRLVRFRTMRPFDPLRGWVGDAQRHTPLGRWLHASSLDELPTLWNVLRGEMSMVGPRPLLPAHPTPYAPERARRHEVLPGITGLAQVRDRSRMCGEQRFAYDLRYVQQRSLGMDLRILGETAGVLWRRIGIAAGGAAQEFLRADTGRVPAPGPDPT
jgi:lipopolysaccharide/colanic/teichoic acid biosynthesis glycosyltransferase